MSSLLSSSNALVLAGVGILAILIVLLAIWLVCVSVRANKERAKLEAIEQRLAHVESYLSRMSKRDMAPLNSEDNTSAPASNAKPAQAKPAQTSSAQVKPAKPMKSASKAKASKQSVPARTNEGREAKQSRRSKNQPMIPYGEAKASLDDVYGGGSASNAQVRSAASEAPASASQPARGGAAGTQVRQSVKHDVRRRREDRRQDQIRRQAENIVQEHSRQSDAGRSRPSGSIHRRA